MKRITTVVILLAMFTTACITERASVQILIIPPSPDPLEKEPISQTDYLTTQQYILKSRTMAKHAANRLEWTEKELEELSPVVVTQLENSSVLEISFRHRDANKAALFINALADEYVSFTHNLQTSLSQATVLSLLQQAEKLRQECDKAESRLLRLLEDNANPTTPRKVRAHKLQIQEEEIKRLNHFYDVVMQRFADVQVAIDSKKGNAIVLTRETTIEGTP